MILKFFVALLTNCQYSQQKANNSLHFNQQENILLHKPSIEFFTKHTDFTQPFEFENGRIWFRNECSLLWSWEWRIEILFMTLLTSTLLILDILPTCYFAFVPLKLLMVLIYRKFPAQWVLDWQCANSWWQRSSHVLSEQYNIICNISHFCPIHGVAGNVCSMARMLPSYQNFNLKICSNICVGNKWLFNEELCKAYFYPEMRI